MSISFKAFIAVSVLLNLLLLGVVFGNIGKSLIGCKAGRHINMHDLVMTLPEKKQQDLEKTIAQFDHDIKQLRDQLLDERKKAVHMIAAEPFNRDAYFVQIAVIQKVRAQITQNIAETLSHIIGQCTDEERKDMADKLIERLNQTAANGE